MKLQTRRRLVAMWTVFVRPPTTEHLLTLDFLRQPAVSDVLDRCGQCSEDVTVTAWGGEVMLPGQLVPREWLLCLARGRAYSVGMV
ncbi:MAG: hypothetical protein EOO40_11840 [Deltaproteobacteria bacterium]|nr:MAG: hypothetical protein EOO40_11840 [Deltaproteobacteria bacterium]